MLFILENKVQDLELGRLCEFLEIIDTKLNEIDQCILKSAEPISDGLCDQGEYYIGIGFVAIQHHLIDSLIALDINKKEAYSSGLTHSSGVASVAVINAAANWWKHEAEWFKNGYFLLNDGGSHELTLDIPKNGERAFEIIMNISNQYEYALSNVLASFSKSKRLSFTRNIIPHIEEWTKVLCVDLVKG